MGWIAISRAGRAVAEVEGARSCALALPELAGYSLERVATAQVTLE
jgi:hypothetical protein